MGSLANQPSVQFASRIQCGLCLEKQAEIFKLKEEVDRLKAENARLKRKEEKVQNQGIFGSSTPSAQRPFKEKSSEKNREKRGGAKPGHPGHGRTAATEDSADRVVEIPLPSTCPSCGGLLRPHGHRHRTILDMAKSEMEKILYRCARGICGCCHKLLTTSPVVLRRAYYGNELMSQTFMRHYGHGISLGKVLQMSGPALSEGGILNAAHDVAELLEPAIARLQQDYRASFVKHADETSWRTDGAPGYCWIFCTANIILFDFRDTRSATVVEGVLGKDPLPGVLIVDRYAGYNQAPCRIQYCYAHLLRDVKDLQKEFEADVGVKRFCDTLIPLLSSAMGLRSLPLSNEDYDAKARQLKQGIEAITQESFSHLGVSHIQSIFQDRSDRLYHWVEDRRIPAENNYAERTARKAVLARKVSFGSQSTQGAKTRGIMMSYLHTAMTRLPIEKVQPWFKGVLDQMALNPKINPYDLLPPPTPP